jgi:streptomycin 6-kinase
LESEKRSISGTAMMDEPSNDEARAALIARLARIQQHPTRLKPNPSLQPTPEAAKSRINRLRRKQRILIQTSKRPSSQPKIPPAPDPLDP